MSRNEASSEEAKRWLAYAREDYLYGCLGVERFPRAAAWCFQQAAEKSLKALCLDLAVAFPRTHDLVFLLQLLADTGVDVQAAQESAFALAAISPAVRYPADLPPINPADAEQFRQAAEELMRWSESVL
jgi:HEPN domain-containing protein